MASNVRKYRPQNDHVERSDLAEILYCQVGEGESQGRERLAGRARAFYPSAGLSMI
jgi:hypothetical protein